MRFILSITAICTVVSVLYAYADNNNTNTANNANNDTVVAEVNHEKIYKSGIDIIVADFAKTGTVIDDKTRQTLIERLVEQKLVAQFAKKKDYLKRDSVQKQIEVMTDMVLRDSYFSDLVKQAVTPQAVKSEFDTRMQNFQPRFEYKASHILVDSVAKANDIKKQLDNKESFKDLAKQHSADGNAETGGDLGYFSSEMMVKPFSDAVEKLTMGQISEPIKTDFGWHIIQLTDKRPLPKPTFEQLSIAIETDLARKLMAEHTEELKKQSKIHLYSK